MADTRLPDVVPAKDLATSSKDAGELPAVAVVSGGSDPSTTGWHLPARGQEKSLEPPIVVQIWSNSGTPDSPPPSCPSTPVETQLLDEELALIEQHRRRSASQYSDSGIESQLASPTVTDNKLHHQQPLVLELSATHLTVPGRFRAPLAATTLLPVPSGKDEEAVQPPITIEESDQSESERSESAPQPHSATSLSTGFLPQKRHHRNFLPLDYSLDSWRKRSDNFGKIRSLPTECERNASADAADESAATAGSWSDSSSTPLAKHHKRQHQAQLSPKICIENDDGSGRRKRESGRSLDEQSTVSESRSVGSYSVDSEGSAPFLADNDMEFGSYLSSRQPSICSVRSESASLEQSLSTRNAALPPSKQQQEEQPPSRSPSARFNFLSVPHRNNVWPAQTDHQRHRSENHSSMHSQLGSLSSLMMNSRLSLSNSYLRLAMTAGGMDDIMLVNSSVDESDRYGDALTDEAQYYEREAAAKAAQLSLTQRLAFPELVEADPESGHIRSKAYGRQSELPREESSLNFFAKIITFLVLVFVIVLVVGVLVKMSHTPK